MDDGERLYSALLARVEADPRVLGFLLTGSRGKGLGAAHSDYDCVIVVADGAHAEYGVEVSAAGKPWLDCAVMTMAEFEAHAAWGGADAWARYSYAHLTPAFDKTGRMQAIIDAKASVPAAEIASFIDASLDHFINQIYRGMKCHRDGNVPAGRLESAEAIAPLLDALFALNGGRLRPYYKYLEWELTAHPLAALPWPRESLVALLLQVLETAAPSMLNRLFVDAEAMFRARSHGGVFDAWGEALPWMRAYGA